jgi:ribonuclease T2
MRRVYHTTYENRINMSLVSLVYIYNNQASQTLLLSTTDMTNSRLRYLVICLGVGLIIFFIVGAIIYLTRRGHHHPQQQQVIHSESCPRPKQYEPDYDFDYTKKSHEYQNINSSIDYFRLSLSWSPTFCDGKQNLTNLFQCQHRFGFIVHGLWPSSLKNQTNAHPRNCRNEAAMPIETIKKYFCIMPSEILMQAEWEKHGTCYWKKPEDYFEQIKSLYTKIELPKNISEILNDQAILKGLKRQTIKQNFLKINPHLTSHQIDIRMSQGDKKLKEVAFCYDQNFHHINCY